ncbi:Peptidyl-prolyl isomerase cwc27 [Podospora pseudopauciseta]|uniref:Peptidyl-prolyl isomerase cwc27 n=1 Tax=Podospora pseudopauciseta TaxID=2093780 RepID=A0ABR0HH91_9PEZI|nr:Peptidyl-prolyl isomerase cwc27 [Podospora pseudopauciseta]
MSAIYNLEPQPMASAIIHTTLGEISIELFAKQTPLTCRNFLQLALDGYYDNTIFHRLIPGFILQGGDPTGTGHGGESIYDGGAYSGDLDPWPMDQRRGQNAGPDGINFKDEFHSRLKFNRRGLLGMANEGKPDTNGSQFFFTLGKAEELNGKNTVFGRVAGDTIYNLAKIGESEVNDERPLYPIKITHIEILINPFDDMKKREKKLRQQVAKPAPVEKKQKKRKPAKQLLSFGDEEGEGDDLPVLKKPKFDTRIVMDVDEEPAPKTMPVRSSKKDLKPTHKDDVKVRVPEEPAKNRARNPDRPEPVPSKKQRPKVEESDRSSPEPEDGKKKTLLERTNEEIAAVKASMKRTIYTEPVQEKKRSALEEMIPETAVRGRKRRPGTQSVKEEEEALALLRLFKSKLEQAPVEKSTAQPAINYDGDDEEGEGEVCDLHFIAHCQSCKAWDKEEKEESDDEGWMSHQLNFTADKLGKDLSYRKKAEEELVVIDPLAKAQALKEGKKSSRDSRSGGSSSRAWNRDRERDRAIR